MTRRTMPENQREMNRILDKTFIDFFTFSRNFPSETELDDPNQRVNIQATCLTSCRTT